jgi:hypothetical protein
MDPISLNLRVGRLPAASAPTGGQLSAEEIDANFTGLKTAAEQLDAEKLGIADATPITAAITTLLGSDQLVVLRGGVPSATAPAAFTVGQWSAEPTATPGQMGINIGELPSDGGSAITALEYRVGTGAAIALAGTGTGLRLVTTGFTAGVPADIQVRVVNAVDADPANWSDTKTRTPAETPVGSGEGPTVDESASTGATFTTVDGYRIATFSGSGSLVVTSSGGVDALVVAGGGSGGGNRGGGGGAGAVLPLSAITLAAQSYAITVGSGGGASGDFSVGNSGESTTFAGYTALGGGGGGGAASSGASGGSGGGGGHSGVQIGGASTAVSPYLGNAGGDGDAATNGGGGGGAGQAGQTAVTGVAGKGGDGYLSSITGTPTYFGGGGGGGMGTRFDTVDHPDVATGGLGGGGRGAVESPFGFSVSPAVAGVANTGGGGGGGSNADPAGAAGGSGVVIVRWPL